VPPPAAADESSRAPDAFSILKNIVFLLALYLYFVGWLYSYYLFQEFGISLNSVDIPFYYFFLYSYSVLQTAWGFSVLVVGFILLFVFSAGNSNKTALAITCMILFPALFYPARAAAKREALSKRLGQAKSISFVLRQEAAEVVGKDFMELNTSGQLRLLTQTKDQFFVFYQPEGEEDEIPYAKSYCISAADIVLAQVNVPDVPSK
jgi:hypothetical protein